MAQLLLLWNPLSPWRAHTNCSGHGLTSKTIQYNALERRKQPDWCALVGTYDGWPLVFYLFWEERGPYRLVSISSHLHYKNPAPDPWKSPGLTQGSVKCLAQGCLQLLLAPQHRTPLQPGCVVQGLGQGQSHRSPQVTSGCSAQLLSLRSEQPWKQWC